MLHTEDDYLFTGNSGNSGNKAVPTSGLVLFPPKTHEWEQWEQMWEQLGTDDGLGREPVLANGLSIGVAVDRLTPMTIRRVNLKVNV